MKYFALLFAAVASCFAAADYTTGQAARLIIGQRTFTAQDSGTTQSMLGAAGGVAYAADTLFVADSNRLGATPQNRRVLIYRNISQKFPAPTASLNLGPRCPVCTGDSTAPVNADAVLGQADFTKSDVQLSQTGLRLPTAIASDGQIVAVADTENNRVLIWNSIPTGSDVPADVVLGQANFSSIQQPIVLSASSFRGPQGVWIQNGRLFVADTQNHRVLIWNSIPKANNAPADIVLGQPNFTTAPEPDITKSSYTASATNLLNPVSVSSDGQRLYVADLGNNRVAIWNDINALQNARPFDVVIGQPDNTSSTANNASAMCPSNGTDSSGNKTYPTMCGATLNFPRYALSDGKRLYIADGGNDRVLIFNTIPNSNGATADVVLGQRNMLDDKVSDAEDFFNPNLQRSAANITRTPTSLAWDGTNLYVADPFDRRVLVFTPAQNLVQPDAIRNSASLAIYAVGGITFGGTLTANETIKITIGTNDTNPDGTALPSHDYTYKVAKDDKLEQVINALTAAINAGAGDPYVFASSNAAFNTLQLTARQSGDAGNNLKITDTLDTNSTVTVSITNPTGGKDAAKIAPGALVTILGNNLCDCNPTSVSDPNMPRELAGVQVFIDGIAAPLRYVSPTQINAQVPFEISDTTSVSTYVKYLKKNGDVVYSTAIAAPVVQANPGIFTYGGQDPRPAVAYHAFSNATAVVSVDGAIKQGDTGTVTIGSNSYTYTVQSTDTLTTVRDALADLINANQAEVVTAIKSAAFQRIVLVAKAPGAAGNGIGITTATSAGANLLVSALQATTCCAAQGGTLVTNDNPVTPGETIIVYATGLGIVKPDEAKNAAPTGIAYSGPVLNDPNDFVSSLIGGKTANVLNAGLKPGFVGIYEVWLQLNPELPDNPLTQVTIAQDLYVSNIVTIPVKNPPAAQ